MELLVAGHEIWYAPEKTAKRYGEMINYSEGQMVVSRLLGANHEGPESRIVQYTAITTRIMPMAFSAPPTLAIENQFKVVEQELPVGSEQEIERPRPSHTRTVLGKNLWPRVGCVVGFFVDYVLAEPNLTVYTPKHHKTPTFPPQIIPYLAVRTRDQRDNLVLVHIRLTPPGVGTIEEEDPIEGIKDTYKSMRRDYPLWERLVFKYNKGFYWVMEMLNEIDDGYVQSALPERTMANTAETPKSED